MSTSLSRMRILDKGLDSTEPKALEYPEAGYSSTPGQVLEYPADRAVPYLHARSAPPEAKTDLS